ncbi:hypothetical protein C8N32_12134 [Rhodovulum imhoffii]|uniref:Uncharacterized protein n=1 Tax=Rhodovulum imhoffii TaxID=365340 RepID=A0A2T5BPB9_9RHOB|nr:hypothetical protein [Rhodovulum imhoffii]MBK5932933.1 hypothetical protein [Rhodovulum imhoffii]PTN00869.1 hypothetical protein C8N32_12134 [Rhodovulum imhoffii]
MIDWSQVITADQKAAEIVEGARQAARARLSAWLENAGVPEVPVRERASWGAKEAAAVAWLAKTATPDQAAMIETEAALTGERARDLCAKIEQSARTFRHTAALAAGARRALAAALAHSETVADCEAAAEAVISAAAALDRT